MRILQLPRVLRDLRGAIDDVLPHARKATEANGKAIELIRELRDPTSDLTVEERPSHRRETDELWEQVRRENAASNRRMGDLRDRHPDWIDY